MKLLLNTYSSNKYAEGCEYAIVDLTPELAAEILRRMEVFAQIHEKDKPLMEMTYYDYSAKFLDGLPEEIDGPDLEDGILSYDEPYAEVEVADDKIEPLTARTECDRMVIMGNCGEVYWQCYPKHCDWQVETCPIPKATIQKAAGVEVTA